MSAQALMCCGPYYVVTGLEWSGSWSTPCASFSHAIAVAVETKRKTPHAHVSIANWDLADSDSDGLTEEERDDVQSALAEVSL